jgi:hypothetical protein
VANWQSIVEAVVLKAKTSNKKLTVFFWFPRASVVTRQIQFTRGKNDDEN